MQRLSPGVACEALPRKGGGGVNFELSQDVAKKQRLLGSKELDGRLPDESNLDSHVLVIGAGFVGLCFARDIASLGYQVTIVEKASRIGGTWAVHDYPGLRLHLPGCAYRCLSLAPLWTKKYDASEFYRPNRDEILEYCAEMLEHQNINLVLNASCDYERRKESNGQVICKIGERIHRTKFIFVSTGVYHASAGVPVTPIPLPKDHSSNDLLPLCFHSSQMNAEVNQRVRAANGRIVVVGSGKAAIDLLQSFEPTNSIIWAHRGHTMFLDRSFMVSQYAGNGEALQYMMERLTGDFSQEQNFICCRGPITAQQSKTGLGVCSTAELAHADRFQQSILTSIEVTSRKEIAIRSKGGSVDILLGGEDCIIFCTGQRNPNVVRPCLGRNFAHTGPFSLNGATCSLVPLRIAVEQLQGSAGMSSIVEKRCNVAVDVFLSGCSTSESLRSLDGKLYHALRPLTSLVFKKVKYDLGYRREWVEDWHGRDMSVREVFDILDGAKMQRLSPGVACEALPRKWGGGVDFELSQDVAKKQRLLDQAAAVNKSRRQLFRSMPSVKLPMTVSESSVLSDEIPKEQAAAAITSRRQLFHSQSSALRVVRDTAATVMATETNHIPTNRELAEIGLSSINLIELKESLQKSTGKSVRMSFIFSADATLEGIAHFVCDDNAAPTRERLSNSPMPGNGMAHIESLEDLWRVLFSETGATEQVLNMMENHAVETNPCLAARSDHPSLANAAKEKTSGVMTGAGTWSNAAAETIDAVELGRRLPGTSVEGVFHCSQQVVAMRGRKVASSFQKKLEKCADCIPPSLKGCCYPLTRMQQRILLAEHMNSGEALYNLTLVGKLRAGVDLGLLENAFRAFMRLHRVLCTKYVGDPSSRDTTVGVLDPTLADTFQIVAVENLDEDAIERLSLAPFNLSSGPSIQAFCCLSSREILLVFHHISVDASCLPTIAKHLARLYQDVKWTPDQNDWKDYVDYAWEEFEKEVVGPPVDLSFWIDHLGLEKTDVLPVLELPRDPACTSSSVHPTKAVTAFLDTAKLKVHDSVFAFARRISVTPALLYMCAFELAVKRFAGQNDLVIGVPVNQRKGLSDTVGMFVNTIALRLKDIGHRSVRDWLQYRWHLWLNAYAHADTPFDAISSRVNNRQRGPFQAVFNYLANVDLSALSSTTESFLFEDTSNYKSISQSLLAEFDLVILTKSDSIKVIARESIWNQSSVDRFLDCYVELLSNITDIGKLHSACGNLGILPRAQASFLNTVLCGHSKQWERTILMHEFFEQTVDINPDSIALRMMSESMTYKEVEALANSLAHYLIEDVNVQVEDCVGILLPQGFDQMITMLAILKAGAAYVPLDDTYPEGRIADIIEDAKMVACVSTRMKGMYRLAKNCRTIVLEDVNWEARSTERPDDVEVGPSNLCYVLYTSGSTGKPKGVEIEHRSVFNYGQSILSDWPMLEGFDNNFLLVTRLPWDGSLNGILFTFGKGGTLCLVPPAMSENLSVSLPYLVSEMNVTRICCAPGLLQSSYLTGDIASIRHMVLGGDVLPTKMAKHLVEQGVFVDNVYGPTETTVYVTRHAITRSDPSVVGGAPVSIGRPIQNVRLYVLDALLNQVPVGVVGELCIGGAGLARGYRRMEDTQKAFVRNPFEDQCRRELPDNVDASRLYQTGDLVRVLPSGLLDFVGRVRSGSSYVKLRGYRVEPGEVSTVLESHEHVGHAVTLVDEPREQLVAFVCAASPERKLEETDLLKLCQFKLVKYMVPSKIYCIDSMPLDSNGKVDTKALLDKVSQLVVHDEVEPPANDVEEQLVALLSTVLSFPKEAVSVTADMFQVYGMNSLTAAKFVTESRMLGFPRELSVRDVYERTTLRELSEVILGKPLEAQSGNLPSTLPSEQEEDVSESRTVYPKSIKQEANTDLKLASCLLVFIFLALMSYPCFMVVGRVDLMTDFVGSLGSILAAQAAFLFLLLLSTYLFKVHFVGCIHEGSWSTRSFWIFRWMTFDYLWALVHNLVLPFLSGTPWLVYVYRAFGANIGKDVFIEEPCIRVPDLVNVGTNSYISSHVMLRCVKETPFGVGFQTIRIGSGSVLQSRSLVDLNTDIGDHVEIGPLVHVRPDSVIQSGTKVRGTLSQETSLRSEDSADISRSKRASYGVKCLQLLSPVLLFIPYAARTAALLFAFRLCQSWTDANLLLSAPLYLLGSPVSIVSATLLSSLVIWVLRRALMCGRALPGCCNVNSFEFSRRWMAQQLFHHNERILFTLQSSIIRRALYRFMGSRMEIMLESFPPHPVEPDLFRSKDGIFEANGVVIRSFTVGTTGEATFDFVEVGRNCMILDRSVVMPGAVLKDNVTVGSGTLVEGTVETDSLIFGNPPLQRLRGTSEASQASTAQKVCSVLREEVLMNYPLTVLWECLVVGTIFPLYFVHPHGILYHSLAAVGLLIAVAMLLILIGMVAKWAVAGNFQKREPADIFSWGVFRWKFVVHVVYGSCKIVIGAVNDYDLTRCFWNAMGAQISKEAFVSASALMLEADLLKIESGTIVEECVTLLGHTFQKGKLEFSNIVVGKNCEIGALSVLLPGTEAGYYIQVQPMTQVMSNEHLSEGCCYGGSPMEWVGQARHCPDNHSNEICTSV